MSGHWDHDDHRSFAVLHPPALRRRLSSFSASRVAPREMSGSHKLTIDGYTQSSRTIRGWSWKSKVFEAAGHRWRIHYAPYGLAYYPRRSAYIALYLEVVHGASKVVVDPVEFKFTLLDQSGNPVPEFTRASTELCCFNSEPGRRGFDDFIRRKDLEESGCLKDDCFSVRCDITVLRDEEDDAAPAAAAAQVVVPPSDLQEQLTDLLWTKKQAADVAVDVGGEAAFDAHGWLLAARSPYGRSGRRMTRIKVQGVEPKVFRAVLHYMYTDALPAEATAEGDDAVVMARDLLAAARMFKLERLRLMCEEMLCTSIDVGTVADTLVVAERHGCRGLKAACVEFLSCPGNLKAAMATEGFEKLKSDCPALLAELVMIKQLDA
ncbi:hypothetical protein BS78_08G103900 [Paspalum vaginatum]|nr:hypothetical protein BS78_08G103900 [Paspalum vaginatum]